MAPRGYVRQNKGKKGGGEAGKEGAVSREREREGGGMKRETAGTVC